MHMHACMHAVTLLCSSPNHGAQLPDRHFTAWIWPWPLSGGGGDGGPDGSHRSPSGVGSQWGGVRQATQTNPMVWFRAKKQGGTG